MPHRGCRGATHLLELIDVNVELIPQLRFRLGESLNLRLQVTGLCRLGIGALLLSFEPGHMILDFEFFGSHHGVKM
jgi:hypothetical protein